MLPVYSTVVSSALAAFLYRSKREVSSFNPFLSQILGITFATAGLLHGVLFMSCTWPREMSADPGTFHRVFGPGVSQKVYYSEYFTWTATSGFIILGIIFISYPLASSTLRKRMWQNSRSVRSYLVRNCSSLKAQIEGYVTGNSTTVTRFSFSSSIIHESRSCKSRVRCTSSLFPTHPWVP